jgi:cobalt-zinc-cadmium efflux system outer membrane protein
MSPLRFGAAVFLATLLAAASALGQGPTPPTAALGPTATDSSLGPLPGAPSLGALGTDTPSGLLVGRGYRRVPSSISRPVGASQITGPVITHPAARRRQPSTPAPHIRSLIIPPETVAPEPIGGLTLDQAIEILRCQNLLLRSRYLEIPQAQADILSAGLRANPFAYVDGQLLPYGRFDPVTNPGGPTQYDANITLPWDWNLKRRARIAVAARAKSVVEAVYQNTVRLQIGELYTAYVDVLAARETVLWAKAAEDHMRGTLATVKVGTAVGASALDVDQMELQLDAAELTVLDADSAHRAANRRLAALLNLPPQGADQLQVAGTLRDRAPQPPPLGELVDLAMTSRPDLIAFRLGTSRAAADVELARRNRFSDVYVLYQPFTLQNNSPYNAPSSTSWTLGATVAVPVWDRNQGVIRRAQTNVEQTRLETQAQERLALADVEDAYHEYVTTRQSVERMEQHVLPHAKKVLDDNFKVYRQGQALFLSYLAAQRAYGDMVRQYRDMLVRHRRSMLDLNTAVGQRVLP